MRVCPAGAAVLVVVLAFAGGFSLCAGQLNNGEAQLRAITYVPNPTINAILANLTAGYTATGVDSIVSLAIEYPFFVEDYYPIATSSVAPDVIPIYAGAGSLGIIDAGAFHNTTAIWERYGIGASALEVGRRSVMSSSGVPYGIPMYHLQVMCTYRVSVFEAAGISSEPTVWSEFLDVCRVFRAAGKRCMGFASLGLASSLFDQLLISIEGPEFYEEFIAARVSLTDPRIRAVFDILLEFIELGGVSVDPPSTRSVDKHLGEFATGVVPMFCGFQFFAGAYSYYGVPVDDVASFPVPIYDGTTRQGATGALVSLGVPVASPFAERAMGFLDYVAQPAVHAAAMTNKRFVVPLMNMDAQSPSDNATRAAFETVRSVKSIHVESGLSAFGFPQVFSWWVNITNAFMEAQSREEANAVLDDWLPQMEAQRVADMFSQAVVPTIDPPSGSYSQQIVVTLTSPTPGAALVYTLDGSAPNRTSPTYAGSIVLGSSGTYKLRALALASGLRDSSEAVSEFVLTLPVPVSASPPPEGSSSTLLLAIMIPAVVLLGCLIVGVGVYLHKRSTVTHKLSSDGDLVCKYEELEVGEAIGHGTFGSVYRGYYHGSEVAIKQAHGTMSPKMIKDFVSEAKMLARLRHPSIVILMSVTIDPPCLITEFCDRGALFDILHSPTVFLDASIVHRWAHQISKGLKYLAHAGVVHGDFKSLNVLMDSSWTPKIGDFGLSAFMGDTGRNAGSSKKKKGKKNKGHSQGRMSMSRITPLGSGGGTRTHSRGGSTASMGTAASGATFGSTASFAELGLTEPAAAGTLFWSSPEILQHGASAMSVAGDAYAFGITLWELATRANLYPGLNPMMVAHQVSDVGLRPDLSVARPEYGRMMDVAVALWDSDPDQRMSMDEAETLLSSLYSPTRVVYPTTVAAPQGRIHALSVQITDGLAWIQRDPTEAAPLFREFHSRVRSIIDGQAVVLAWDLDSVTVSALRIDTLLNLASRMLNMLASFVPLTMVAAMGDVNNNSDPYEISRPTGPVIDDLAALLTVATGRVGVSLSMGVPPPSYAGIGFAVSAGDILVTMSAVDEAQSSALDEYEVVAVDGTPFACIRQVVQDLVPVALPPAPTPSALDSNIFDDNNDNSNDNDDNGGLAAAATAADKVAVTAAPVPALQPWRISRAQVDEMVSKQQGVPRMGSYAKVSKCTMDGAPVLLKVLLRQDHTPEELMIFAETVFTAMAAGAKSTMLAGPLAVCLDPPRLAVVWPFETEGSLLDVLREAHGAVGPATLKATACSLSTAVCVLHDTMPGDQGHGALRPSNVLVSGLGLGSGNLESSVVLVDYGMMAIRANMGTMTMAPTAAYMAPEEMQGAIAPKSADVFILGSVLYELSVGEPAFRGQNALEIAMKIMNGVFPVMDARSSSPPPALANIIQQCWTMRPEGRPSIQAIADLLSKLGETDWI